jgi:hypothetical protein
LIDLENFKNLDLVNSTVTLWFFKRPAKDEHGLPKYRGNWLDIDDDVESVLKDAAILTRDRIDEVDAYGLLAQAQEGSGLEISADETNIGLLTAQMAAELGNQQIIDVKGVLNSLAYAAKFVVGGQTIFGFKRLDSSWSTKRSKKLIPAAFVDDTLTLAPENTFQLEKTFDFFALQNDVLVCQKSGFETVLFYKAAHTADFGLLVAEPDFVDIFDNVAPLVGFVGDNKLKLRRASAIRQKRHYADQQFMTNLRARHVEFLLTINFDANGRIIPCEATCLDIFSALLDHRLKSGFSDNIYAVPDVSPA